jgi:hypothetical protein
MMPCLVQGPTACLHMVYVRSKFRWVRESSCTSGPQPILLLCPGGPRGLIASETTRSHNLIWVAVGLFSTWSRAKEGGLLYWIDRQGLVFFFSLSPMSPLDPWVCNMSAMLLGFLLVTEETTLASHGLRRTSMTIGWLSHQKEGAMVPGSSLGRQCWIRHECGINHH